MQRRQRSEARPSPVSPLVPLGGETFASSSSVFPSKSTTNSGSRVKRVKKSREGCLRSCLVQLRCTSSRKTLSGRPKGTNVVGGGIPICVVLSILVCFFVMTLTIYYLVEGTNNRSVVLQATTYITSDLRNSLVKLRPSGNIEDDLPLLFQVREKPRRQRNAFHKDIKTNQFYYPRLLSKKLADEGEFIDFGGIDIKLLPDDNTKRQIYIMVEDVQGNPRSLNQERDDDYEPYWNYDDDIERNPYKLYDYWEDWMEGRCRRVSWHRGNYQTCNNFHELDLVTHTPRFVGDGAYREVFVTEQPHMNNIEELILKELRWDMDMAYDDFEYVRMDAYVTERLTSNNQISDIFGYCGLSMLTEYFSNGDIEEDLAAFQDRSEDFNPIKEEELITYNKFTPSQKLKLALAMVEPVQALHNFKDGVIVHDDIQLCQYLWTDETKTSMKLNDFNRAEIMLWDEEEEKYCKYKNGKGHGDWRAPEEYKDLPLNEKIDIWSLGNNMYSLLTGYYPFFNVPDDQDVQKMIKGGKIAEIDPRFYSNSCSEAKLADIILKTWKYWPDDRPSIEELRRLLLAAIKECAEIDKVIDEDRKRGAKTRAERKTREEQKAKEANERAKQQAAEEARRKIAEASQVKRVKNETQGKPVQDKLVTKARKHTQMDKARLVAKDAQKVSED